MMTYPSNVNIIEVGPRDGLQSISQMVPTEDKVTYINHLSKCGFPEIEITSFVSPKWVPQLADAKEVSFAINRDSNIQYTALIPNLTGLRNAIESGFSSIAIFTTPSEPFSQKNTNCTVKESIQRIAEMQSTWESNNLRVRGYISTVWYCPYKGKIQHELVSDVINQLMDLGIQEISLGDTIGEASQDDVRYLLDAILSRWSPSHFALHMHDTYGNAIENIRTALEFEINTFDSSAGGIGGCPYAEGASGNVASEKISHLCDSLGIETGIDTNQLNHAAEFIQSIIEKESGNYAKD